MLRWLTLAHLSFYGYIAMINQTIAGPYMSDYLSIPMALLPDSVKLNMQNQSMTVSNDGLFLMLHSFERYKPETIDNWLRDEPEEDREQIVIDVLAGSTGYTKSQVASMMKDPDSIWFTGEE